MIKLLLTLALAILPLRVSAQSNDAGGANVVFRFRQPEPDAVGAGFSVGGGAVQHLRVRTIGRGGEAARDQHHVAARIGGGVDVVDHAR